MTPSNELLLAGLSAVQFTTVAPTLDVAEQTIAILNDSFRDIQITGKHQVQQIKDSESFWLSYASFVKASDLKVALVMFSEFAADAATDPEKIGFETGEYLIGSQAKILDNPHQIDETGVTHFDQIQSFLIEKSFDNSIKLNQLLARIRLLEQNQDEMALGLAAAVDNATANKVHNFEYNQFHRLPLLIKAMADTIASPKLDMLVNEYFGEEDEYKIVSIH